MIYKTGKSMLLLTKVKKFIQKNSSSLGLLVAILTFVWYIFIFLTDIKVSISSLDTSVKDMNESMKEIKSDTKSQHNKVDSLDREILYLKLRYNRNIALRIK